MYWYVRVLPQSQRHVLLSHEVHNIHVVAFGTICVDDGGVMSSVDKAKTNPRRRNLGSADRTRE